MQSSLPPLSSIRAFEAASRHLSFTKAADELGMTQAAVSYQIKLLEETLGLTLFIRKTRRIELTEHGAQLSSKVVEAFEDLKGQNAAQLVVSSNTTFAVNWLANRLVHFQMQNPDLAVRIIPYGPNARPEFFNSDVVVSACKAPPKGWIAHELVRADFTPMLSPALAETIGGLTCPEDLLKLPLVDAHDPWWKIWFDAAGMTEVDFSAMPRTRMGSQALEANRAIAGQGVAILTPYFCKTALDTGQLIQPFDLTCRADSESWYLSYPPTTRTSRKIRLFREWVYGELEKDGMPLPSQSVVSA
ncbi:LysR family transcriptional regulator [Roseibium denhamense]|uniref:LysR family transcriptional regulator, glycine cleavage system transcriptional activator n=1 Tax=Roseibium denhamense TaxID=76305 RepID=A0ABY1PDA1_9HYPH|nr:LysR family transcriptional regulator [Roseibium denhamense]MTI04563.1 LysR family transcriptional regulator [Roseibium denhamense]SMP31276.1 LysR family transcriptional regulator, glycine cleavage system transcriptional activator [Roseibium denhamense]